MKMHVGLIGAGNISETHARAALAIPGIELAAIFGENAERVRRLGKEYGVAAYTDFGRFLGHQPMTFVVIGSPSGVHAAQGIEAARRGLHVLTEKPIDITTRKTDELILEADKAQVKLGVIYQDRFKPGIQLLKQLYASGKLGEPILVEARVKWYRPPEYYSQSRWRGVTSVDGGGALMSQGIHTVDLLLWLLGDITAVQAQMKSALHKIESEDTLTALLEFANGTMGSIIATTSVYPGYPRRVELSGSEGTVILENDRVIHADLKTPLSQPLTTEEEDKSPSASSPLISDIRGHKAVMEDFVRAIETGSTPACDGREGRRSVALVEAIYEAARTRKRVLLLNP
ncbi:MAG TPA: Gfo/Idh/MocA family oxidoreductase [Terriglobales bacterium]|nr:Gfo/Idh/MocA family oxidoreductase [Terriglobales bacterium]